MSRLFNLAQLVFLVCFFGWVVLQMLPMVIGDLRALMSALAGVPQ